MDWSVEEVYQELIALDEHPRIEAKRATHIGDSIMQTVCAFANEPGSGGGFLLLGISEPDETHNNYWVTGVTDTDKLLNELQGNCRTQFDIAIPVQSQHTAIEGKLVIGVFIPELDPAAKPCGFIGKHGSKNKRKTGVWRRGLNGDYECSQQELAPLLLAKSGMSFEQVILSGAEWDDLDPSAIELYRQLRSRVRPQAEELQASDEEMLRALRLVEKRNGSYLPNVAGLLLLAKPLSLRRLLPVVRVDYVRIQGTQWVEDPSQRFATTQDFREPIIRLITRLEATILDDMPRHFILKEGETQRADQPLLPHKVVREAVVNALMHRDYQVNQPTLVVRYSNRLEIRNSGYSLKPETMLGEMGSQLRNPIIAAVLYDLDFAETKGTGIRTMRRLLTEAGLTVPVFTNHQLENQFTATYLLHQLMDAEQLEWLKQFSSLQLADVEAKALVLAKEMRAIDNGALRSITGLDTLTASQVLGKLCKGYQLLVKGGKGPATYYRLSAESINQTTEQPSNSSDLKLNSSDLKLNSSDLKLHSSDLKQENRDTPELSDSLQQAITELTPKARKEKLWPIILMLIATTPRNAEALGALLKRDVSRLKTSHLNPLREQGLINYLYPEVVNHPEQAYQITPKGKEWLKDHPI
ncbi:putative DNA binding domain-containing protein [Endozoicomonas sp. SM1973]|uniref:DNA binding domain-containing protein n=1 Tax=Spartinivicinus marinus TaxID=2994442 RepID=A0A853I959_9GAMM|nr:ATP-binding protein [Spartinivicinus marinus]MCX4027417.1 putative DNA binding domain-containing protein [Spartinivicinus marinus]NYZ66411.1 putative DNA binding domain-containing protein [Spartinivicinus marinus]